MPCRHDLSRLAEEKPRLSSFCLRVRRRPGHDFQCLILKLVGYNTYRKNSPFGGGPRGHSRSCAGPWLGELCLVRRQLVDEEAVPETRLSGTQQTVGGSAPHNGGVDGSGCSPNAAVPPSLARVPAEEARRGCCGRGFGHGGLCRQLGAGASEVGTCFRGEAAARVSETLR